MTPPRLAVVAKSAAPKSASERLKALQAEASALAREQVGQMLALMAEVERLAHEIASEPAPYPPGVPDLVRRFGDDCAAKSMTLSALMERR